MAPTLPGETSIRTLLSIKNGIGPRSRPVDSAVKFAAKAFYVFDTVRHVIPIFPHAGEGSVANRARSFCGGRYGHVDFNNRTFLDRHLMKGSEDAVLVLRGDRHALVPSIRFHEIWAPCGAFWRFGVSIISCWEAGRVRKVET